MPSPTFDLFEDICRELSDRTVAILPEDEFLSDERLLDLQDEYKAIGPNVVMSHALKKLKKHFKARGSDMPFTVDWPSRTFSSTDKEYIDFVAQVSNIRGVGRRSRSFEEAATRRLSIRGAGHFHRVGWPRGQKKKRVEFVKYLRQFGFDNRVVFGKEKDGGLDIIWMLPFGAIPHRPIVSIQCKNGSFDLLQADQSNGSAQRSLSCHRGLNSTVHTLCVVFNDYIISLPPKPFNFVALGLSDLASPLVRSQFAIL